MTQEELGLILEDDADDCVPTADGYEPTPAEKKLLKALFNPRNMDATVKAICQEAGVSRETYYQSIRKPGFVGSIKAYALDATKGKAAKYVHLLEKFAGEGSFAHLRVLLSMSGLYDEKITIEAEPVRAVLRPRGSE